ncbi:uncharacterized protein [Patagioenas fasciata]|uniref:uncharacterized protein n=1 Tax=Patagioenas fasciata TaxID=372321 RepID=UPI003A9990CD
MGGGARKDRFPACRCSRAAGLARHTGGGREGKQNERGGGRRCLRAGGRRTTAAVSGQNARAATTPADAETRPLCHPLLEGVGRSGSEGASGVEPSGLSRSLFPPSGREGRERSRCSPEPPPNSPRRSCLPETAGNLSGDNYEEGLRLAGTAVLRPARAAERGIGNSPSRPLSSAIPRVLVTSVAAKVWLHLCPSAAALFLPPPGPGAACRRRRGPPGRGRGPLCSQNAPASPPRETKMARGYGRAGLSVKRV